MTKLIRPDNGQPAEYVTYLRGHVCLRLLDTVTPAVRWFSDAAMFAVNPMSTCAEPPPTPRYQAVWERTPYALTIWQPVIALTPALAANVNHVLGCSIKVVPPVSLWHKDMVAA